MNNIEVAEASTQSTSSYDLASLRPSSPHAACEHELHRRHGLASGEKPVQSSLGSRSRDVVRSARAHLTERIHPTGYQHVEAQRHV